MNHINLFLLALVLVSAADVVVTRGNLAKGGTEKNFLPKRMIAKFGFWPTVAVTKGVILGVPVIGGFFFPAGVNGYYAVATVLTAAAIVYSLMSGRKP